MRRQASRGKRLTARLAGVLVGAGMIGIVIHAQAPPSQTTLVAIDVTGIGRYTQSDVVGLSGLAPGQTLTRAAADAAASRLADTGLFSRVTYQYQASGSAVHLTFDVIEERWTVPVVFDNFVWFGDDDLTRDLRQRVPTFDGTAPANANAAGFIVRELQRVLDGRGIHGRVDYSMSVNLVTGAKAHVFVVKDAGDATRVCAVRFEGASPPMARDLARAAGLIGSPYSRTYLEGLLQGTLAQIYRRRGYLRAEFEAPRLAAGEAAGCSGVAVTLKVSEGLSYAWAGVRWSGNAALSPGELNSLLDLAAGDMSDPQAIQKGLVRAHAAYESRGYLQQSATLSLEFNDATKHAALAIVVAEGPMFRMGTLTFSGFSAEDEAALRKQWRLRTGDAFDAGYPGRFVRGIAVAGGGRSNSRPAIEPQTQIDATTRTVGVAIVLKHTAPLLFVPRALLFEAN